MTDPLEEVLAPTAIEQVISIFEQLKDRDHGEIGRLARLSTSISVV
jgi:hypothetical protein